MLTNNEIDRRYLLRKYNAKKKAIIVTDLHLGFEAEWVHQGINTKEPKWSFEIINSLKQDILETDPNFLIILGDLEHSFTHIRGNKEETWVSNKNLKEKVFSYFLEQIHSIKDLKIILIHGNQDTSLNTLIPADIEIYPAKGVSLFAGELGVFHGNAKPSETVLFASEIVLGHVHPAIELIDELNIHHKLHVFAKLLLTREELFKIFNFDIELEEIGIIEKIPITILPAYNTFLGGYIMNRKRQSTKRFPFYKTLIKLINHPELSVQMTNGIDLGFLRDI